MAFENVSENVRIAVESAVPLIFTVEADSVKRMCELDNIECALEDNAETIRSLVHELVRVNDCITPEIAAEQKENLDSMNALIRTLSESRGYMMMLKCALGKKQRR